MFSIFLFFIRLSAGRWFRIIAVASRAFTSVASGFAINGYACSGNFGCRFRFRPFLPWRESDLEDGIRRAFFHAFPAKFAFNRVYVGEEIFQGDGIVGTDLNTFPAADAGHRAAFFGDPSLFLVDAADEDLAVFLVPSPEFNDVLGTGIHACTACRTFFIGHLRQACPGIHMDGVEIAYPYAVPVSQASVLASGIAGIKAAGDGAGGCAVVKVRAGPATIGTRTPNHRNLGILFRSLHTEDLADPFHGVVPTDGTEKAAQGIRFHAGLCEIPATGVSASSAVCGRQCILHLVDSGILDDPEPLRNEEQYEGSCDSGGTE
jgi:hypothetical protein